MSAQRQTTLTALNDVFNTYGNQRVYWIALSGGLDSQVLLHTCAQLRSVQNVQMQAIHIHHGLSPNATLWAERCTEICERYQVQCMVQRLQLSQVKGQSLEAVAREERYAIFAKLLAEGDILITAHHQDDQAETVLMQLLRGAGLKGLAAMPYVKHLGKGFHVRPFLNIPRENLQEYAQSKQLTWIEDESNQNETFTRNFIRQRITPILKQRFPSFANTFARSAMHCAEAQTLLEEMMAESLTRVRGLQPQNLSVEKLLQFPPAKQKLLLRTWIFEQGFPLPSDKKMQTILSDVLMAARDRKPLVDWHRAELRRFRDDLFLCAPAQSYEKDSVYNWNLQEPLHLPGVGQLQAKLNHPGGLSPDIQLVQIRFRQGGEMARISGRGRRSLKKLFQEWNVPTWLRDRIPLIYYEEKLLAVVGYFTDEAFKVGPEDRGYEIKMHHQVPDVPVGD